MTSSQAAARRQQFAGQPAGIVRCQEDRDLRNVACVSNAAEGSLRNDVLLEVGADDALRVRAFGLD